MVPQLTPQNLQELADLLESASRTTSALVLISTRISEESKKLAEQEASDLRRFSLMLRSILTAGMTPRYDAIGNAPKDALISWKGDRGVITRAATPEQRSVQVWRPVHGHEDVPGEIMVFIFGMNKS